MINQNQRTLGVVAVGVYMLLTLFSLLSSFLESLFIASWGGASVQVDAFLIGKTIPELVITLLITATYVSIVPAIIRTRTEKGEEVSWILCASMGIVMTGFAFVVSLIVFVLSPQIIVGMIPGYSQAGQEIATITMQIILSAVPVVVCNMILRSVFESYKVFWPGTLPGILRSLFVVGGVIFLTDWLGVYAIALGIAVSQFFSLVILLFSLNRQFPGQILSAIRSGFQMPQEIYQLGWTLIPVSIVLGIYQIYNLVDRPMATLLPEGSISNLNYAFVLVLVPHALIGSSLSTLIFPSISETIARGDYSQLSSLLVRGVRLIVLLSLPVIFIILSDPDLLVALIFERGQFLPSDTILAGQFLREYILFFPFYGVVSIVARTLVAIQKRTMLVSVAAIILAVKIIVNALLVEPLGASGLILGTNLSLLAFAVSGYVLISRFMGQSFIKRGDINALLIIASSSGAAFVVAHYGSSLAYDLYSHKIWQIVSKMVLFCLVYLTGLWLLRSPDLQYLAQRFVPRLLPKSYTQRPLEKP